MMFDVVAFYRFVPLSDLSALRERLLAVCKEANLRGTILIAPEGINGTVAGPAEGTGALIETLDRICQLSRGEVKHSSATAWPFARMKVRIRPEIITMRAPEADPGVRAGTYVAPADWNELLADPDILLIDTRNRYETKVGTFEGAVDPQIDSFTEFKDYVETARPAFEEFGGKFLARGGAVTALEGQARPRNVIIEFESVAKARACYESPAYQKAVEIRQAIADADLFIVEGYDG